MSRRIKGSSTELETDQGGRRARGGTVVVPSSFNEGFGDVLPESLKGAVGK